jgi:hypothetical protein
LTIPGFGDDEICQSICVGGNIGGRYSNDWLGVRKKPVSPPHSTLITSNG